MLTQEQRQLRRQYLGSSDSSALFNLDPFKTAADVYLEKTGADPGFGGNDATERGNFLEPAIVSWAEREIGIPLTRDQMRVNGVLCANLDACGFGTCGGFGVEAKTATNVDEWGAENSDEVPDRVLIQTAHGMFVTGFSVFYVPVLLPVFGRFEFRMYRVDRDERLVDAVVERGHHFMEHNVKLGIPPSDSKPSLEVLKRVRRTPNKTVTIDSCLVDRWIVAKAAAMQAKDDVDLAQAAILEALADSEGGECKQGLLTFFTTKRAGYVVEPTEFRQLRLKKRKD